MVGLLARHQTGPRWIANRHLAIRPIEADTARSQAVDVRGLCVGIAVAAQGGTEIVDGDEEDVGPFGGGVLRARSRRRAGWAKDDEDSKGEEADGVVHEAL